MSGGYVSESSLSKCFLIFHMKDELVQMRWVDG